MQHSDYTVFAPSTPMHSPGHPGHRPDVLDVVLIKLPHYYTEVLNINELSSDHNPILLKISDAPILSAPYQPPRHINWSKFSLTLNTVLEKPSHFTTQQLVKLTVNHNNKKRMATIFLDVEKAFDRLWRDGLIHMLRHLDTPIQLLKLISSFLSDRYF